MLADRTRTLPARLAIGVDALGVSAARLAILVRTCGLAGHLRHVLELGVLRLVVEGRLAVRRLVAGVGRVVPIAMLSGRGAVLIG